jgi:hypothetical protein
MTRVRPELSFSLDMTQDHGFFSGQPLTRWLTEDKPDRKMALEEAFMFTDPEGKAWDVPSGFPIDGASIPKALWSLIGSPYTGDYRRASIVHDKACNDAKKDCDARRAADRMFYHACRAGGCSTDESKTLYLGVRIGALKDQVPLWSDSITESFSPRPRASIPIEDRRVEADFRLARDLLSREVETDDPLELEAQVDRALELVGAGSP